MTPESPTDEQVQAAPRKTLGLAKWLAEEAEVYWALATNEKDKQRARRMQDCAKELIALNGEREALAAERAKREEAEKRIAAWILAVEQTTGTPKEDWGQHQDALTFLLNWFESHKQSLMERASLAESDASQTADQNNLIQETLKSRCAELAALKAAKEELEKELSRRWDKATQEHYEKLEAELGRMRVQFDNLKAAKEEAEAVAGQRYHYALNEPILKARIEELSQDRDVCLVRAEKAEAEVARLKSDNRFHRGHSAGYTEATEKYAARVAEADRRLIELEEYSQSLVGALRIFLTCYPAAINALAEDQANHVRALANREAAQPEPSDIRDEWEKLKATLSPRDWTVSQAVSYFGFFSYGWNARAKHAAQPRETVQQTRGEAKEGSCVHCGKPWYVNMPHCVFHPDTPQQAAQPSATQEPAEKECLACGGMGGDENDYCERCDGTGFAPQDAPAPAPGTEPAATETERRGEG